MRDEEDNECRERKVNVQCHQEEDSFRLRYGRIVGQELYRLCC